jgi:hypothetical protein
MKEKAPIQKGNEGTQREEQYPKPRKVKGRKKAPAQIQNPSLRPKPFTTRMKQIRQKRGEGILKEHRS